MLHLFNRLTKYKTNRKNIMILLKKSLHLPTNRLYLHCKQKCLFHNYKSVQKQIHQISGCYYAP